MSAPPTAEERGRPAVLSASEIGRYLYCRRAWWLARVRGLQPTNQAALNAGRERHRAHGAAARRQTRAALWARALALAALLLAALWLATLLHR
ncbi:MAG: hypothetical protein V1772_07385 [Chloroflexota bacterium]